MVKIWEDPWFGDEPPFRIPPNESGNQQLLWVKQLMDALGKWDLDKINALFSSETSSKICQTKIEEDKDRLIWIHTSSGEYSAKSGYNIAYLFFHPTSAILHERFKEKGIWKAIWKTNCQPKIRIFIWKLIHNGLSVKEKLHERIPQADPRCPRCSVAPESALHSLVFCPQIAEIWNNSPMVSAIPRNNLLQPWQWWIDVVATVRNGSEARFNMTGIAYLLWGIWLDRNSLVFKGSRKNHGKILTQAMNLAAEFRRSRNQQY
ncbi:hypothetical protein AHAS_Ahas12G0220300 [Arachis hypogaea]|nr:uncharacterized protein LOC112730585 [Arachis hypogaea]